MVEKEFMSDYVYPLQPEVVVFHVFLKLLFCVMLVNLAAYTKLPKHL